VTKEDAPKSIGANSLWVFQDVDAKADYLEFSGPGIEAQEKEKTNTQERAIMFGAQLFSDNRRTAESGEALRLRLGNQTSTLKMVSVSSAAGLERTLKDAAVWAGANPDEVKVEPNLEFVDPEMTPQDIVAMVGAWQSGAIRERDMFNKLQRAGEVEADISFEDWKEAKDAEGPSLGMIPAREPGQGGGAPADA
jgi:hypothetical protein